MVKKSSFKGMFYSKFLQKYPPLFRVSSLIILKKLGICFIQTNWMTKKHSWTRRHIEIYLWIGWSLTSIEAGLFKKVNGWFQTISQSWCLLIQSKVNKKSAVWKVWKSYKQDQQMGNCKCRNLCQEKPHLIKSQK